MTIAEIRLELQHRGDDIHALAQAYHDLDAYWDNRLETYICKLIPQDDMETLYFNFWMKLKNNMIKLRISLDVIPT